ncbi:hypothetical protein E2C01_042593 [Portunus trituberculatus]|uniref:Uncharacterized protein n=1 Tax=Portunus trituberculatus TaxID=210409 RepID=A0A5B7FM83_PORTR|nr:hypothetical protein [Portunus trituberculatus]
MTLGQSSPQLGGREGDNIRLPSSGRKVEAKRFHSLAVTCIWAAGSFQETLAKCSAKRLATVLGSATVRPADNKTGGKAQDTFQQFGGLY